MKAALFVHARELLVEQSLRCYEGRDEQAALGKLPGHFGRMLRPAISAGVDDFEAADATYRAAVARWPMARIMLRQGIRVEADYG